MSLCEIIDYFVPLILSSFILRHLQVFDTILDKCGLHCEGATAMEPMKLNAHQQPTAMTMSQQVRQTHTSPGVTACRPNELITISSVYVLAQAHY